MSCSPDFLFKVFVHRRDPHSFPTRRSSDLEGRRSFLRNVEGIESGAECERLAPALSALADGRSEEHTSELQSLRHLVCRLLLEKKKDPDDLAAATPFFRARARTH